MAESMVEEPLGFFCHRCWMEIRPVLPGYLCPHCSSGFIEELDATAQTEQPPESDNSFEDYNFFIESTFANNSPVPQNIRINRPRRLLPSADRLRSMLPSADRLRSVAYLGDDRQDVAFRRELDAIRDQLAEWQRVDFYAHDYAWNREGLDAIVTHLLNQMDVSGPPPLAKERIDEIPVVNILQQQVDASLQCPVCWEDFRIEESVRKLMCEHFFHENCIIPWLELHGTCPVCRKWLFEESNSDETSNIVNEPMEGQRPNDLTTQLETLLSAGLTPMPVDMPIPVDIPIPVDASDEGTSNHDMSCG